jgi:hypothetical protein
MAVVRSEVEIAAVLAAAALTLAVVAFAVPLTLFPDDRGDVSSEHVLRLKTQASMWTDIPAVRLQAIEARSIGPSPDHVAGTVVFRTLFGVPWGRVEVGSEPGPTWHTWRYIATGLGFVGAEAVLLGLLGWRLWTMR